MSRGFLVMIGMTVGSIIGGYVPVIWGASLFSFASLIANAIGGLLGIWLSLKLTQDM